MKTETKNLRTVGAVALLLASLALAACNTTKGAGKDMENLGENVQDTAERSKP